MTYPAGVRPAHARVLLDGGRDLALQERLQLLLGVQEAEVAVEVAAAARDPVDAPAHPLPVGEELLERRAGGEQQRGVPGLQVGDLGIERVRDRGADRAACLVGRPEHEVVDEQLGAAVEEIGERLRAVLGLEPVVLLDRDPRQLAPLPGQLVAAAGELLLLLQQLVALRLPLLLRADPVVGHDSHDVSFLPRAYTRPDHTSDAPREKLQRGTHFPFIGAIARLGRPPLTWCIPGIVRIAALACGESGSVRPGTCRGARATPNASTTSVMATRRFASSLRGSSFSTAIEAGDGDHPRQAHHAECEQRGHQSPAAADAPRAVHDAHAERSRGPVTPVGEHEVKRPAAAAQAGVLDGRELVDRRRKEHPAGEIAVRRDATTARDRERAHADVQAVREQPERRPRQRDIRRRTPTRRRCDRPPRDRVGGVWTNPNASTIGTIEGNIIALIITTHDTT